MSALAAWRRTTLGELGAEFLGTFVLICFGDGVVAMAVAALNQSGRGTEIFQASGDWLLITWGWGFAVTFGVYIAGGISGAHINPAVTIAFAARRGFPWRKVPGYIAAQLVGAFLGAALVYVVYKGAIDSYERAHHIVRGDASSVTTYSIFATFPAKYFATWVGPFVDQVVGTAFLVAFVFAVVDEHNQAVGANLAAVVIGFIVVAIGLSFGANAGYAINPARDFGPRLFALIAGWGKVAIPGNYGNINGYLWIPIVGPIVGGLIGAVVYDVGIRDTLRARGTEEPEEGRIPT
ncbi:MAG TPA: MIP family channel protein [Solirubrobacter sp.]|nr:MIP family channel protein [Solirubrobacter sp.]